MSVARTQTQLSIVEFRLLKLVPELWISICTKCFGKDKGQDEVSREDIQHALHLVMKAKMRLHRSECM